jgi:hypothetical protein
MELKFIKIPKTGSTFFERNFDGKNVNISNNLTRITSVGHSWNYHTQIKGWLDWDFPHQEKQIFRDVIIFNLNRNDRIVTIVRNPFEILFSYFNYNWADCRIAHNLFSSTEYTKKDFQTFVDIYLDFDTIFHAPAFKKSLFSQLKNNQEGWLIDENSIILRFENLKEDINNFAKKYNLTVTDYSDSARNESKYIKPCKWNEAYRDDQVKKLSNLWEDDLNYFGYTYKNI